MPESVEFKDFVERNTPEVLAMQELMSQPLSENPSELAEQLVAVEAHYARATTILAWADAHLDAAEADNLPKEGTELQRRTAQRKECIPHRRFRDVLDGLCRAINMRLSIGQSLLRAMSREFGPGGKK